MAKFKYIPFLLNTTVLTIGLAALSVYTPTADNLRVRSDAVRSQLEPRESVDLTPDDLSPNQSDNINPNQSTDLNPNEPNELDSEVNSNELDAPLQTAPDQPDLNQSESDLLSPEPIDSPDTTPADTNFGGNDADANVNGDINENLNDTDANVNLNQENTSPNPVIIDGVVPDTTPRNTSPNQ